MNRRGLMQRTVVTIPCLSGMWSWLLGPTRGWGAARSHSRVRPGDPAWPSEASWDRLGRDVGGRLVKVRSPLAACTDAPVERCLRPGLQGTEESLLPSRRDRLTQSLGWVDAWTLKASVYAVAAWTTEDVVAAVNFARENNLRVVVMGGGHSYQGTSNAPAAGPAGSFG
jgi:FAD binding domain